MTEQAMLDSEQLTEEAAVGEMPVGLQLRHAREKSGISLASLAQTLKLGQKQLESLESGEWDKLPGPTFIRGFVRNYARIVQLDPDQLMQQLDRILVKPASNLDVPASRPVTVHYSAFAVSHKSRQVVALGTVLVVLAAAIYFLLPNDLSSLRNSLQSVLDSLARKDVAAIEQAPAKTAEAVEPVFPPGVSAQQVMNPQVLAPAEPTQIKSEVPTDSMAQTVPQVRLVADKESWVEIRNRDNRVIFSQRMPAGAEQTLSGDGPLSVVIGFSPGVRLYWHGQVVDLTPHARGDVARLVLE